MISSLPQGSLHHAHHPERLCLLEQSYSCLVVYTLHLRTALRHTAYDFMLCDLQQHDTLLLYCLGLS